MIEFIVLCTPACISMLIHTWLLKKERSNKEYITIYGAYACIINFINFLVLYLVKDEFFFLKENFDKPAFVTKIFILSLLCSIIFPFIVGIIGKNITFKADFVDKKNENIKKHK